MACPIVSIRRTTYRKVERSWARLPAKIQISLPCHALVITHRPPSTVALLYQLGQTKSSGLLSHTDWLNFISGLQSVETVIGHGKF